MSIPLFWMPVWVHEFWLAQVQSSGTLTPTLLRLLSIVLLIAIH
jgi:hypothetical protein